MPFIHPAIFWTGLAAASAPIIIHLLNRRRFKVLDWAAMKFLLDALRKNRRRLQIEEIIMLLVRTLILILLALALARFTGCAAMDSLPGSAGAPRTTVFILDDSFSMGQKVGGGMLFNKATTDLCDEIKKTPPTDRVEVILTSKPEDPLFSLSHITDAETLVSRIQSLKPSDLRTDISDSLRPATQTLTEATGQKRLCLFSDFRRDDISDSTTSQALRKYLANIQSSQAGVFVFDYGLPGKNNLTIQSVDLLGKFAVAGKKARIGFKVRNNGSTIAKNVKLRLWAKYPPIRGSEEGTYNEVSLPMQVIRSIEPGQVSQVEFDVEPPVAGSAIISVKIDEDELTADNTANLALDVKDAVKVLIVDGDPDIVDPSQSESFYLKMAIDPLGDGIYGFVPQVITPAAMDAMNFDNFDLIMLVNVPEFPVDIKNVTDKKTGTTKAITYCPVLKKLQSYIREGGGLMIYTGDRMNLDFYNNYFFDKGMGMLPYRIGPMMGDASGRGDVVRLDPVSISADKMMEDFRGDKSASLLGINFFAFTPAVGAPAQATETAKVPRILAKFTDEQHSPAIVSRQFGKGNVVMVFSTVSKRWNDWASDPVGTFVTFIFNAADDLARAQKTFTEAVGSEITYDVPEELNDARISVMTPRYPEVDIVSLSPPSDENGRKEVQFDNPRDSGIYRVMFSLPDKTSKEVFFSRCIDPREGVLTPAGHGDIESALGGVKFDYFNRVGEDDFFSTVNTNDRSEYWIWAIAIMLALMGLEIYLARRFGHHSN